MTKQHPLTDEICDQITDELGYYTIENAMRACADWQLEQVIEWFTKTGSGYLVQDLEIRTILEPDDDDDVFCVQDLKKAMRPQEDNS